MPRQIDVVAGILRDADGRFLITDRSQAASMQEYWEFPGGKVRDGESPQGALQRELAEELGIAVAACEFFRSTEHDYPDLSVAIRFYLVREWSGDPAGLEGQQLRWVDHAELDSGILLPADAPIVSSLRHIS